MVTDIYWDDDKWTTISKFPFKYLNSQLKTIHIGHDRHSDSILTELDLSYFKNLSLFYWETTKNESSTYINIIGLENLDINDTLTSFILIDNNTTNKIFDFSNWKTSELTPL